MHGQYRFWVAILALATSAATAQAAEKSVISCTSGELVRRVVVEVGDLSTSLPCEVVYWKDKEAPGVRRVLWNARSDPAYCDRQAGGLVDKLSAAGWSCSGSGQLNAGNAAPAAVQPATPAVTTTVPSINAAATPSTNDWNAPAGQAELPKAPSPQQPLATTTPEANTAPPTETTEPVQTAALPAATSSAAAPIDQLESVIQTNLTSLNQSVDGDFKAKIGDFGDLNNDGIDDAVVFFNYESSTADFTQFVAAYLYNGETYHLAATKPVGGTDLAVREVVVEDIVQGSIQLKLQLNDSSQAGDRRASMILKDGQLVETE